MTVNLNWPLTSFQVAFNADPNDGAAVPSWTDLVPRLRSWNSGFGRQYETDTNQAGEAEATLDDEDELLNPANGASPYAPGIVPYRSFLYQAMWPPTPVGAAVNMLNTTSGYDPTFDTYTAGTTPSWIAAVGGTTPTIGTTTPHSGANDVTWSVVNGATVQGVTIGSVACIPGQQYTASAYVRQTSASTQQISIVGGPTGNSFNTTGAWVRVAVTFTATQPTHQIQVATLGTAVAGTVLLDDVQLEPGGSSSTFSSAIGPVVYGVSRGQVERWPSTWDYNGIRGRCDITCIDALAALAQLPLHTEYVNAVLAKSPDYFYRLNDGSAASTFADSSSNGQSPLIPWASKYGAGSGIAAATNMTIVGDPGATGVGYTSPALLPGQQNTGTILAVGSLPRSGTFTLPAAIGTSWAITAAVWVANAATSPTSQSVVMVAGVPVINSGGGGDLQYPIKFTLYTTGQVEAKFGCLDSAGTFHSVTAVSAATGYNDGLPHLLVATVTQANGGNTVVTLYVDGAAAVSTTVTTASLGGMLTYSANTLEIGGSFTRTTFDQMLNGPTADVAIWNRALSAGELTDLWNAGGLGYAGDLTGARITRYLSYGYTGLTAIDAGTSVMGISTLAEDTSMLEACQAVTTSENGDFWADQTGTLVFKARTARYLATTAKWVLGENAAGGEAPYETGITYDSDPSRIGNKITVTRTGGIVATATDAASVKSYYPRKLDVEIGVLYDQDAIDFANWLLYENKQPKQRVSGVALHPSANPALWPVVLGIRKGDRVTVKRRTSAGVTMNADFFVEKIEHSHSLSDWLTSLELSPAAGTTPWILEDPTYGLLDSTAVLAW